MAWSQSQANDARDGPYRQTVALATARIGGFDAKSAEALTLIARGSGAPFEERFRTASASASGALSDAAVSDPASTRSTRDAFDQYLSEHAKLLALDEDGQHDDAVTAATGDGPGEHGVRRVRSRVGARARHARRPTSPTTSTTRPRSSLPRGLAGPARRVGGRGAGVAGRVGTPAGVPMRTRRVLALVASLLAVAAVATACESDSSPSADEAPTTAAPATPATTAAPPAPDCGNPVASFAPLNPMPAPGDMPAGTLHGRRSSSAGG